MSVTAGVVPGHRPLSRQALRYASVGVCPSCVMSAALSLHGVASLRSVSVFDCHCRCRALIQHMACLLVLHGKPDNGGTVSVTSGQERVCFTTWFSEGHPFVPMVRGGYGISVYNHPIDGRRAWNG